MSEKTAPNFDALNCDGFEPRDTLPSSNVTTANTSTTVFVYNTTIRTVTGKYMETDALGDRIKKYEAHETGRTFLSGLPIYARIDGRSFSKFTSKMERPFDIKMSQTMIETARYLVEETQARIGYTQSDEISLTWFAEPDQEMFFNNKIFKLTSTLAAMATAKFNQLARNHWPALVDKLLPTFDCRIFQLPSKEEGANCFVWRELDATKNAISMAARHYFSHNELHKKNGKEMQEMLFQKHNINFNDYPTFFKRGTYLRRETYRTDLSPEILAKIPEAKRAAVGTSVLRSRVVEQVWPQLSKASNKVDTIYHNASPMIHETLVVNSGTSNNVYVV